MGNSSLSPGADRGRRVACAPRAVQDRSPRPRLSGRPLLQPGSPAGERCAISSGLVPASQRRAAEPGWVRGDLHRHTRHSDGDSWPEEVLAAAAMAGLDFLGITDHNGVLPHDPPPAGSGLPLLVPGVEVTTYGGHWNAWGGKRWYDFREPDGAKVGAIMRQARADGALVSVNHPRPLGPPWAYAEATRLRGDRGVERSVAGAQRNGAGGVGRASSPG